MLGVEKRRDRHFVFVIPVSTKSLEGLTLQRYKRCMDDVAKLLNTMVRAGLIENYAVFGAVAQMRYTEAVATMDADILVVIPDGDTIDILNPIYTFCAKQGYQPEGEAIRVGDWPVQFIPAFSALTNDAVQEAETADLDGTPIRVIRADYLAVIALSVGRAKDFARVLALLDAGAVTETGVAKLAENHGLAAKWKSFQERFRET